MKIGFRCATGSLLCLIGAWCVLTQLQLFEYAFSIPRFTNTHSTDLHSASRNALYARAQSHSSNGILNDVSDAPPVTDKMRLAEYCPLRRHLCLRDRHWVTPYAADVFNVTQLMFGTGIHAKFKYYRDQMYATHDADILSRGECLMLNESMIVIHAWYPHMLWEVWNRVATQLFQYQVLDQFLSKEHRFLIMQLQSAPTLQTAFPLGTVHDLLLSPFTNYPLAHLHDFMWNQTRALHEYGITKQVQFYDELQYPERMAQYRPMYDPPPHQADCTCIEQVFWCGFDATLEKDVKQLPSIFDGLGHHEFGEFSWDMARWYKWYFIHTYGGVPERMSQLKTKPRLVFIQRRSWKRVWTNLNQTVRDCNAASQGLFECVILYFEDISHIEAIWTMQLADILIGIHGSGLVNGIFMNERATLLEIVPRYGPDYLFGSGKEGSIMTWIYKFVPQRHAWLPLMDDEQEHSYLADWQKPVDMNWSRLQPAIRYLMEVPHDFCDKDIPPHLQAVDFGIGDKHFVEKSPLYNYRPTCNSYDYLTM